MRKMTIVLAATLPMLSISVRAQDELKGMEMDVMDANETPSHAIKRIELPSQANLKAQNNSSRGRDTANAAREQGAQFGQDTAEQARERHGNPANSHGPPTPTGHGTAPQSGARNASADSGNTAGTARPDTVNPSNAAASAHEAAAGARDNKPTHR